MKDSINIKNIIAVPIGIILGSFYYFPVAVSGVNGANSKLLMAVIALGIMLYHGAVNRKNIFNGNIVSLLVAALLVSMACFYAVVWNGTSDYTYVGYIFSMLVWLAGAYTFVSYLKFAGFRVNVENIALFLMAIGVMQCILALLISRYPVVEEMFVRLRLLTEGDIAYARRMDRLFGVGCSYDPGGIRLGGILILAGVCFRDFVNGHKKYPMAILLYLTAFILITVVGSMISRTTSVGALIALGYYFVWIFFDKKNSKLSIKYLLSGLMIGVVVVTILYITDDQFKRDFRFGFEGFVSLVEKGSWEVESNDRLKDMYVFPDNLHTWVIGDGYFDSTDFDQYYIGKRYKDYYKSTDVGYLRFIYYGGLIFLISFIAFFCVVTRTCCYFFPRYQNFFLLLFTFQLIVWFKVATDIFCLFAVFLSVGMINQIAKESNEMSMIE